MSDLAVPPFSPATHWQEQFDSPDTQFRASETGMWLFMGTELLLFGGLFVGFAMMNWLHPDAFFTAHHHLNRTLGTINTLVLLISSYFVIMAVESAKCNRKKGTVAFLWATIGCAVLFLAIKCFEYAADFHEGLLPGRYYHHAGDPVSGEAMFYGFYFTMTGLHAIHIITGSSILAWVLHRARKGEFSQLYFTPVEMSGLYWHLVDIIWIFLFPLLYLIG